jgi:hypothetical protein
VDYRDVLATVVGASVAGIVAFFIRLAFPVNAAVLALIYAATYSLLWSIVGEHARLIFKRRLPASTRFDGHWRLVTGGLALTAALCAGLIVAFAVSSRSKIGDSTVSQSVVTRTVALQPRVVVTRKTIILPVKTTIVTTPVDTETQIATSNQGTSTVFSHTVVVVRPPVTVTISSTRSQTSTVTTPVRTVTAPVVTTAVTTPPVTIATDQTTTAPSTDTTATTVGTTTAAVPGA